MPINQSPINVKVKKFILFSILSFWSSVIYAAYSSITVFGDSALDGGNDNTAVVSFYKLYGDPFPPNLGTIAAPFENFRFSDGLVSAEQMAKSLGLFNSSSFFNFSVGGALAKDLNDKINTVYTNPNYAKYPIDPTGLYVIEAGQVDLLRGLSTPEVASTNVINGIQNLYNRGARHFVLFNSINLGYMPDYKNANPTAINDANVISTTFNNLLKTKVEALSFSNNILIFDNAKYLRDIQLKPASFGITNILDACIISTATGQYCNNRQEYIFWDTVHVTGRTQELLGLLLTDTVTYPNVSILSPANNANIPANTNYRISVNAKDGDGNITKVEFYDGSTLLGTSTVAPYFFDWIPAIGQHTITARAYDNENKSTSTSATIVNVNSTINQPPSISLNTPITNNGGSQGSVTATAADVDGTISKVEFYANNNLVGTVISAPYLFSWSNVTNGTYILTAKAYDNSNATSTSAPVSITVSAVVNTPPTVTLNQPQVSNAGKTQGSITAIASDSDGTISKVEFYANNSLLSTVTASPFSLSWLNPPNGTYSLTAKAYDNNQSVTTSNVVQVVINSALNNNIAPIVNITAPTNNATLKQGTAILISASATDSDGSISKVELYDGTTLLKTDTTFPYTFTLNNASLGAHSFSAKAFDNSNLITTSTTVNITVIP